MQKLISYKWYILLIVSALLYINLNKFGLPVTRVYVVGTQYVSNGHVAYDLIDLQTKQVALKKQQVSIENVELGYVRYIHVGSLLIYGLILFVHLFSLYKIARKALYSY